MIDFEILNFARTLSLPFCENISHTLSTPDGNVQIHELLKTNLLMPKDKRLQQLHMSKPQIFGPCVLHYAPGPGIKLKIT